MLELLICKCLDSPFIFGIFGKVNCFWNLTKPDNACLPQALANAVPPLCESAEMPAAPAFHEKDAWMTLEDSPACKTLPSARKSLGKQGSLFGSRTDTWDSFRHELGKKCWPLEVLKKRNFKIHTEKKAGAGVRVRGGGGLEGAQLPPPKGS